MKNKEKLIIFLLRPVFISMLFSIVLAPLWLANMIDYNPLITITDILSNVWVSTLFLSAFGGAFLALSALLFLYFIGGVLYYFVLENIKYSHIYLFSEFVDILDAKNSFLVILLIVFYFYFSIEINKKIRNVFRWRVIECELTERILYGLFFLASLALLNVYHVKIFDIIEGHNVAQHNKGANFKAGGQLYAIIYDYLESRIVADRMDQVDAISKRFFDSDQDEFVEDLPDIHIILLESFMPIEELVDIENINIDKLHFQPVYSNFVKGQSVSPVFGGNSAAAEFEVLCGLPEQMPFNNLTFNLLKGRDLDVCFTNELKKIGYELFAFTGTRPHFHNAATAYKSLGFEIHKHKGMMPHNDYDCIYPSDESIYNVALNDLKNNKNKNPKLFYIFTAAGHMPYCVNSQKRSIIDFSSANDVYLNRIYYSQKELVAYVNNVLDSNPNTIIVAVGDHQTRATRDFQKSGQNPNLMNYFVISNVNRKLDWPQYLRHFELPHYIYFSLHERKKHKTEIMLSNDFSIMEVIKNNYE